MGFAAASCTGMLVSKSKCGAGGIDVDEWLSEHARHSAKVRGI
jgi:hypothetical protein